MSVGAQWGKVRALLNAEQHPMDDAGPSVPAQLLGLGECPEAGDWLEVHASEKLAKAAAEETHRLRAVETAEEDGLYIAMEREAAADGVDVDAKVKRTRGRLKKHEFAAWRMARDAAAADGAPQQEFEQEARPSPRGLPACLHGVPAWRAALRVSHTAR